MKPQVSVVILNWNGKSHLTRCLESLRRVSYKPLEVIVVDNHSSDDSVPLVRTKFPWVKIIANTINRGFSGGNNDGIRAAKGIYIFIINNDTQVGKGFLDPLVELMEMDESIGCCQPKLVYGDNHQILNAVGSYYTGTGFLYHYGYRKDSRKKQYNQRLTIYSAKGAAMMLRKSALDRVGAFDEDFFIYFEETDLCHRLWLAGFKVVYEPASIVYHYEAVDTHKQMGNAQIMYLSYRNRIASFVKNLSAGSLFRVIPALIFIYIFLILQYIVRLQWQTAAAVVAAVGWNIFQLPVMLQKRIHIQGSLRDVSDKELFKTIWRDPPLMYYYYLFTSLKNFRYEPSLVEANRY